MTVRKYNLLGMRFGKILVVGITEPDEKHRRKWVCKCDCGNTKEMITDRLVSGKGKSCGCLQTKNILYSFEKELLRRYKDKVKSKEIEWSIGDEAAINMFQSPCFYCGEVGMREIVHRGKRNIVNLNGIDRVDSNLGYSSENTVSCCPNCNFLKNRFPQDVFYSMIKKIYEYKNLSDFSIGHNGYFNAWINSRKA